MTAEIAQHPGLQYVGRRKWTLGLGSPWTHQNSRQARYWVKTKEEALDNYRTWLKKCIDLHLLPFGSTGLQDWEKAYMHQVAKLAHDIRIGSIVVLGCYCIDIYNYQLVPDGLERCHAEILYKACLRLIKHWENMEVKK